SPAVTGPPVATISLADPDLWTAETLDFDWDVMRPSATVASQVDLTQATPWGTTVTSTSSGLSPLDQRPYPDYAGRAAPLLLTAADELTELGQRDATVLAG